MAGLTAQVRQDRAQLGIAMMLGAYMLFAAVDTSVKWLVLAGFHAFQLAFMRYLGHFLISLVQIGRGGVTFARFGSGHVGLVLLRASFLVASTVLNFIALNYLTLTVTSAIMFSAPIILCALSVPLLGERVGPWRWFAIFLGFAGVLVIIRPFDETFHWAALLSVGNAFSMAFYSVLTRRLAGLIAAETMQLYAGALGTVVLFPLAVMTWQTPDTGLDWALMLGLGLWGWAGHELLTRAHGFAPANTLMPYTYSFMIYLTITSYVVFGNVPDIYTLIGAAIVVFSGLLIWQRERALGLRR
ncbi:DMT family transporter [Sedimentitalea arenosa]|jgi:drug/metabolite transporter (DMT)-like permease|uniref:DMT family transporter n=1 Tax=Sedimentitalea arenosa TaxID=2798803 RepID=A0A8J7IK31_9RHOB|nr:DMT family transporter [Arenibacterium arenosum]MBJ6371298.1 DMT family transporter [Arenibacterium arenosum]